MWWLIVTAISRILVIVWGFVHVTTYAIDKYFDTPEEERPSVLPDPDDIIPDGFITGGAVGVGLLLLALLWWRS
tara:strand:- start:821 stop:1042 length:222 start_codon:yes stop_codon:yes gene_type:complete